MRGHFDQHSLGWRIVAIAAAYFIALATPVANYAAARAAVQAIADPLGVICHAALPGEPAPSSDQDGARRCIDNCCNGCLTLTAALPPPASAFHLTLSPVPAAMPFAAPVLVGRVDLKSHRSRAPPQAV